MTPTQKKRKIKKVKETYLKFRYKNLLPKRQKAEAKRLADIKENEENKRMFLKMLNTPLKNE